MRGWWHQGGAFRLQKNLETQQDKLIFLYKMGWIGGRGGGCLEDILPALGECILLQMCE